MCFGASGPPSKLPVSHELSFARVVSPADCVVRSCVNAAGIRTNGRNDAPDEPIVMLNGGIGYESASEVVRYSESR